MTIRRAAGFTLMEMAIIIILLGILSVGAYVRWPGNVLNLDAQARQLAADLYYTQSLAMNGGQRYRLVKTSANTYQIQDAAGTAVPTSSGATTVTLNRSMVFGTLTNLPNSLLNYDGRGIPYTDTGSPGTALSATAAWTLSAGSESTTVSVTPSTGYLTIP